jgi:AcrR family transcriptional regulator
MNGFERRTEKKKNHILNIAQKLMIQKGIKDVNILDIAQEAGVSHVTLYHYWGHKQGLVDAVMDKTLHEVSVQAREILDEAKTFEEGLDKVLNFEATRFDHYELSFKNAIIDFERNHIDRDNTLISDSLRRFMMLAPESPTPVRPFSDETVKVFVYLFRYLKTHGFLNNPEVKQEITEFFKAGIMDYSK